MNRRLMLAAAASVVCIPVVATAQVPTLAANVCAPYLVRVEGAREPDNLTVLYNAGNWTHLQARARQVIDAAKVPAPASPSSNCKVEELEHILDYRSNYIAITWIAQDPLKDKPQLLRVIVHDPALDLYVADLPGIGATTKGQFVELFVGRSTGATLTSLYTSTKEENPITSQLPAFVQAIATPLFGTIAAIEGPVKATRGTGEKAILVDTLSCAVSVRRVLLPLERASIRLQASAADSVDPEDFRKALSHLAGAAKSREAAYSECARKYADRLARDLAAVPAAVAACGPRSPNPSDCLAAFDTSIDRAFKESSATCSTSSDDAKALRDVDQKFREAIRTATSATADLDITFHNRPLTKVSFGAGTAVIGAAGLSQQRVKLDNSGNLQADPLTRVITMAFVNWSPRGYDQQAVHMQRSERWRAFFGAALTPDFGPITGLNVGIARGIGLTVGTGVLLAKGADDQANIGKPPPNPTEPFKLSFVWIGFAGISYNFK